MLVNSNGTVLFAKILTVIIWPSQILWLKLGSLARPPVVNSPKEVGWRGTYFSVCDEFTKKEKGKGESFRLLLA